MDKNNFKFIKNIGKGSFAIVKLARDILSKKYVAIKILDKKTINNNKTEFLIRREIEIQNRLKHPNIVKLFGYFQDYNYLYLVTEYCENKSLHKYINTIKNINIKQKIKWIYQIFFAICYMHNRNIIHRDIKLENLFLDSNLNIKISDFGCSKILINDDRNSICGTI